MSVQISAHVEEFFKEVLPVVVGTARKSGRPRLNAAWFEYRDGCFWLNTWRGSSWLDNIERERAAVLFLIDPENMFRTAEITARLIETTTHGAVEHINRLSYRYQGSPYQSPRPQERVVVKLDPVSVRSNADMWAEQASSGGPS
jgi:putative heme iron utilization protein